MAKMGRYCKAYPVNKFREFIGWKENLANLRKERKEIDGKEIEVVRDLTDDDHFYLQENYTVTDDIFINENIIFDDVTPEWLEFCKDTLKFEIPVYESVSAQTPGAQ